MDLLRDLASAWRPEVGPSELIALAAVGVSLWALRITRQRARCAELVVTRTPPRTDAGNVYWIENVGEATAREVTLRLTRGDVDLTRQTLGHEPVEIPSIAPRHKTRISAPVGRFAERPPDQAHLEWRDGRRRRQTVTHSFSPHYPEEPSSA